MRAPKSLRATPGGTPNGGGGATVMPGSRIPAGIGKGYHFVFELYFPTLVIGGRTLIENGRLLVLDDPEVRALAGKLGSSEDWLKEAWIPAVPGINTEKASTGSQ